jgi:hypothetical protein
LKLVRGTTATAFFVDDVPVVVMERHADPDARGRELLPCATMTARAMRPGTRDGLT